MSCLVSKSFCFNPRAHTGRDGSTLTHSAPTWCINDCADPVPRGIPENASIATSERRDLESGIYGQREPAGHFMDAWGSPAAEQADLAIIR